MVWYPPTTTNVIEEVSVVLNQEGDLRLKGPNELLLLSEVYGVIWTLSLALFVMR